jgi:hypothetical protein
MRSIAKLQGVLFVVLLHVLSFAMFSLPRIPFLHLSNRAIVFKIIALLGDKPTLKVGLSPLYGKIHFNSVSGNPPMNEKKTTIRKNQKIRVS